MAGKPGAKRSNTTFTAITEIAVVRVVDQLARRAHQRRVELGLTLQQLADRCGWSYRAINSRLARDRMRTDSFERLDHALEYPDWGAPIARPVLPTHTIADLAEIMQARREHERALAKVLARSEQRSDNWIPDVDSGPAGGSQQKAKPKRDETSPRPRGRPRKP